MRIATAIFKKTSPKEGGWAEPWEVGKFAQANYGEKLCVNFAEIYGENFGPDGSGKLLSRRRTPRRPLRRRSNAALGRGSTALIIAASALGHLPLAAAALSGSPQGSFVFGARKVLREPQILRLHDALLGIAPDKTNINYT